MPPVTRKAATRPQGDKRPDGKLKDDKPEPTSDAAAASQLSLTVLTAAAAEASANVLVPAALRLADELLGLLGVSLAALAAQAAPLGASDALARLGFHSVDYMTLALNASGAFLDGLAAHHEETGSKLAAAKAAAVRGGFLSAFTSFTGMAYHAGELCADESLALGAAYVAASFALGALAYGAGRRAARGLHARGPFAAVSARAPLVEGVALAIVVLTLGSTLLAHDVVMDPSDPKYAEAAASGGGGSFYADTAELSVGMLLTMAGVVLGGALGATARANACACALVALARFAVHARPDVLVPGGAAELRVGLVTSSLVGAKFISSFCGSSSAFCGTVGEAADAARAGGYSAFVRSIAPDALSALACALLVARLRLLDLDAGAIPAS